MKKALNLSFTIAIVLSGFLVYQNRFNIVDWYRLRGYDAPAFAQELSEQAKFNDYGERLFFVNKPQLLDKQEFNQNCPVRESGKILGCINFSGIYILDITEPELENVEVVTAAHEMLHEAYRRLSGAEKDKLVRLLDTALTQSPDSKLDEKLALYEFGSDDEYYDELFAFVGTTIEELPAELEEHYSKYFTDRVSVVMLDQSTNKLFADLEAEAERIDSQITDRQIQLDALEASLNAQRDQLISEKNILDQERNSISSDNFAEYNQKAKDYNAKVAQFNDDIESYNSLISQLRDLIDRFNNVQVTTKYYDDSLNSKVKL